MAITVRQFALYWSAIMLMFASACVLAETVPADRIYRGGTVLTMDDATAGATAVAINGNRIVAVGSEEDIEAFIGKDTKVQILNGKTLIPGFIDAHSHLLFHGLTRSRFIDLNSPPVGVVNSIEDIFALLKERAAQTPAGDWVLGFGYDDTLLRQMRHPSRQELDEISTEHPIWLTHVSAHMGVANSRALAMAGIDATTPEPEGGVIHRDSRGEPSGLLEEKSAMWPVVELIFDSVDARMAFRALAAALDDYASKGITTAQDGAATKETLALLAMARKRGLLKTRVVAYPNIDLTLAQLDGKYRLPFENDDFLRVGATKAFSDGSIQGYTGYLSHGYHIPRDPNDPDNHGYPQVDRKMLVEQVKKVHASGGQIAVHGNGDAAIDDILHAFEVAQKASPREDARPVIIHSQMVREDQLDKIVQLGVIPSLFNMHTYYWGDRHRDIFIGPERAARISPLKSIGERGIRYTLHADTPVVPMTPLRMLWSAVSRKTASEQVLGPEQRVSVEQALRALTIDAAYQYYEEHSRGSISVGKLADMVVLDANPLTVAPDDILNIQILETLVDGQVVYRADKDE
ncbi:MAG: amidohydrolase [Parahaliea sp.]